VKRVIDLGDAAEAEPESNPSGLNMPGVDSTDSLQSQAIIDGLTERLFQAARPEAEESFPSDPAKDHEQIFQDLLDLAVLNVRKHEAGLLERNTILERENKSLASWKAKFQKKSANIERRRVELLGKEADYKIRLKALQEKEQALGIVPHAKVSVAPPSPSPSSQATLSKSGPSTSAFGSSINKTASRLSGEYRRPTATKTTTSKSTLQSAVSTSTSKLSHSKLPRSSGNKETADATVAILEYMVKCEEMLGQPVGAATARRGLTEKSKLHRVLRAMPPHLEELMKAFEETIVHYQSQLRSLTEASKRSESKTQEANRTNNSNNSGNAAARIREKKAQREKKELIQTIVTLHNLCTKLRSSEEYRPVPEIETMGQVTEMARARFSEAMP